MCANANFRNTVCVRSILEYGLFLWDLSEKRLVEKIERI